MLTWSTSLMTMMSQMMQEQIVANQLESKLTLVQLVIQKIGQFNSKGSTRLHMVALFNRVVTLEAQVNVAEFHGRLCVDWSGFQLSIIR